MKRLLLLPSLLREFLEVLRVLFFKVLRASLKLIRAVLEVLRASLKLIRAVLEVLRASLKLIRAVLEVLRASLNSLGHPCDLQCEFSQLRGEVGRFDGWHFDTRGRNEVDHNSEGIDKFVDLPGEMAKAKQIQSRNVLKEGQAVDRFPFDYPGLFNDLLDLILGTHYSYGHSDTVDRDLRRALVTRRPVTVEAES